MELTDVRRLTGPNYLLDRAGAAAEIVWESGDSLDVDNILDQLKTRLEELLAAVDWDLEEIVTRAYPGGGSIYMSAPIDALYSATSLIEAAYDLWLDGVQGVPSGVLEKLKTEIEEERHPGLLRLRDAAREKALAFLSDDDEVSIGLGQGRILWDVKDIPVADDAAWDTASNIPVALVTGTNGKSTTVRLACAIAAKAGHTVASSSSDYVRVGDITLDEGDYSGPGGARMALRDPRADMAILETARGGLMRRGLPVTGAQACLITNVSADHLGEYGITDVPSLADAKFMLAKATGPQGRLVLNYDDPELVARAKNFGGQITWYGLSMTDALIEQCQSREDHAAFVKDGVMMIMTGHEPEAVLAIKDFPISMGGAAKFNISNGLGAMALTSALGIGNGAMTSGLREFESTPESNPGRGNFLSVGGVKILLDFAHNPGGVAALADMVKAVPATRRLFLLGQAGDRSDEDIKNITKAVHASGPDMVIIKELPTALRGRELGDVPKIILKTLHELGVPDTQIMHADCEFEAAKMALEWARPGDFLVFLVYRDRQEVLDYVNHLIESGWKCGDVLPD